MGMMGGRGEVPDVDAPVIYADWSKCEDMIRRGMTAHVAYNKIWAKDQCH